MEVNPPRCTHCGGLIRPGVVWFGENLPQTEFCLAEDLVDACDVVLVVGTSGVVYSAAELPINAHRLGKFVAEVNSEPSEISSYMKLQWFTTAAQGLSEIFRLLGAA